MPRLRHFAQERVIGMLQAGHQASAVSRIFNVHESTILRRRRRVQDTDSTDDRPRSGRPRATTVRQVRLILLIHLRDRFRPSTQTAAEIHGRDNHWISDQTVRNRLRENGPNVRRPLVALARLTDIAGIASNGAEHAASRQYPCGDASFGHMKVASSVGHHVSDSQRGHQILVR